VRRRRARLAVGVGRAAKAAGDARDGRAPVRVGAGSWRARVPAGARVAVRRAGRDRAAVSVGAGVHLGTDRRGTAREVRPARRRLAQAARHIAAPARPARRRRAARGADHSGPTCEVTVARIRRWNADLFWRTTAVPRALVGRLKTRAATRDLIGRPAGREALGAVGGRAADRAHRGRLRAGARRE
jgi:hypothetical protein